jgi:hypothetical protein
MTSGDIQYGVPTNVFCSVRACPSTVTHLLGHGRCELARDAKVGKLDLSVGREEDVGGWRSARVLRGAKSHL